VSIWEKKERKTTKFMDAGRNNWNERETQWNRSAGKYGEVK
jgi:hypothetical protein